MALNNPYALYFDGINDSVQIPDNAITNGLSAVSVFAWIKPVLAGDVHQDIVDHWNTVPYFGFKLRIRHSGYIQAMVGSSADVYPFTLTAINILTPNEWQFIGFTYNRITLTIYHNGVPVAVENSSVGIGGEGAPIWLGASFLGGTYFYRGSLDEVRIYNRALEQSEIQNTMHRRLNGDETGLISYYRLDEGILNTVYDSSPYEQNGTINGATWVPGEVDLATISGNIITGSARLNAAASIQATGFRGLAGSARLIGAASMTAVSIRKRGGSARLIGGTAIKIRAQKTAIAKPRLTGNAVLTIRGLVLYVPSGAYLISLDEIFNRNQPITPDSLANYIEVYINPLQPVAEAIEVYKSTDPIPIDAGEIKTITVFFNKQPVIEGMAQLENAPIGAAISEAKYYAWGADITVTSPSAGAFDLIVTGKPLEVQGRELVVKKDETSILENGIKKYTFDNPFVQDRETAEMIAEKLLAFAVPQADIEIEWRGDPALQLADVVMIPEYQRQGLDQRGFFYVTKQELDFDGGLRAKLEGRKMYG